MNTEHLKHYLATGRFTPTCDSLPITYAGDKNNFDTHGEEGERWIGFDLDGTLAKYDGWKGIEHIGDPIKPMVDLAKRLHDKGVKIKIFTARVDYPDTVDAARKRIEDWCAEVLGFVPAVTCEKDGLMETCFDDRSVQVIPNTGIPVKNAFAQAMEIIADLTDGYTNCGDHQAAVDRLVQLYLDID